MKNIADKRQFLIFSAFFFVFYFSLLPSAFGVRMFFETEDAYVGQTFFATLFLDPEGTAINAVESTVHFSPSLEVKNIQTGVSVIGMWLQSPLSLKTEDINQKKEFSFSGIIPGGYQGDISPFWKGHRPGKILVMEFFSRKEGPAEISLKNTRVLSHDGSGSSVSVNSTASKIAVREGVSPLSPRTERDTIAPIFSEARVVKDPSLFQGKFVLIFSAEDKESGIREYQIKERKSFPWSAFSWHQIESPHLLSDQSLSSIIELKAIDGAGNESVQIIPARYRWYNRFAFWAIAFLVGIGVALLLGTLLRKKFPR